MRSPRIVHETFEDEVVVVDLDSGQYCCLQGSGVAIWSLLLDGLSTSEITDALACEYDGSAEVLRDAVERFSDELVRVGLIVPLADGTASDRRSETMPPPAPRQPRPFSPPTLQVFADMQDLLAMDAVREVNPQVWSARGTDPAR